LTFYPVVVPAAKKPIRHLESQLRVRHIQLSPEALKEIISYLARTGDRFPLNTEEPAVTKLKLVIISSDQV
jgi:hypothetical protein